MKDESTQSASTEMCQRSVEGFLKSPGSSRENLAALLKEASRLWHGSGSFEEELLHLLPVESMLQYISSRLANDPSFSLPFNDYQKIMDSIAKRVTHIQFVTLFYKAIMANAGQNTGCP
jgi:hypothetical protein